MAPSSWLKIPDESDFSLANIPYGVATIRNDPTRPTPFCVTALGDHAIHLGILQDAGAFDAISDLLPDTFMKPTLNQFLEHSPKVWPRIRDRLIQLFATNEDSWLRENEALRKACIVHRSHVQMHLPITVKEYTDFYSSREHATNVGVSWSVCCHVLISCECFYFLLKSILFNYYHAKDDPTTYTLSSRQCFVERTMPYNQIGCTFPSDTTDVPPLWWYLGLTFAVLAVSFKKIRTIQSKVPFLVLVACWISSWKSLRLLAVHRIPWVRD